MDKNQNNKDILIGVTKDHQIINNSSSPDEYMSIVTLLMRDCARMTSEYSKAAEKAGVGKYMEEHEVVEIMAKAVNIYKLKEAGMTDEEVKDVMNMDFETHEIHPD